MPAYPQQSRSTSARSPLVAPQVSPKDQARASVYGLLAALLRDVPGATFLEQVRALESATKGVTISPWPGRVTAGRRAGDPAELDDEYHRLFIGLGRGELVPYGSWYQTGFLMEQPLGELRRDLKALGFERQPGVHEPEDHVAALCEVMSALALDPEVPTRTPGGLLPKPIGPWIGRFCRDLESVRGTVSTGRWDVWRRPSSSSRAATWRWRPEPVARLD